MKALAWLFSFSLISPAGRVVNFDAFQPGVIPPGWSVSMTNTGAAPRWEIIKDGSAPTPPYVFAQMSSDPASNTRSPLAIYEGLKLRDGDVSVRIKPVSGKLGQAGGVVWRFRDERNYYLARANALENNVSIFRVENGVKIQLGAGVKHPIPRNSWSILKVSIRGDRFQVYLDHRRILEGFDKTFSNPGKVGLWTMADSITYFDDFRVYPK